MAKLEDGNIESFRPQRRNLNKHKPRGMSALEASMRKHGYVAPMTAAADGELLDGSARLETVATVFDDDVLVIRHDGTKPVIMVRTDIPNASTNEARAISAEANRIAQINLDWDAAELLADLNAGIDLGGIFDKDELDGLLSGLVAPKKVEDPGPQIDKADELRQKWGVELGQLWQLGAHRLICGDCTDKATVERLMQGEKADIAFTSPPYNGNTHLDYGKGRNKKLYEGFSDNMEDSQYIELCHKAIELTSTILNGFLFWNISYNNNSRWQFIESIYPYREALHEVIIWKKKGMPISSGLTRDYEFIFCLKFGNSKKHISDEFVTVSNFWEISNLGANDIESHRAAFPVELPSKAIQEASERGGIVYEPFNGSGTTLIACEQLSRQCRAIELDPGYCAITLQRFQDATKQTPVLIDQLNR